MSSKFKYPIDAARVYTLQYDGFSTEVTGEDILAAFRRGAYLDKVLAESDTWQKIFNQNPESQETSSKT